MYPEAMRHHEFIRTVRDAVVFARFGGLGGPFCAVAIALSGMTLSGMTLSGMTLSGMTLSGMTLLCACSEPVGAVEEDATVSLTYTEERAACTNRTPRRMALFGELHSHTAFSFDARSYGTTIDPAGAYGFARGDETTLTALGTDGEGSRKARLDRPLDFAAITDHSEFLGEIGLCTTPGSAGYDSARCVKYRDPAADAEDGAFDFGIFLSSFAPKRPKDIASEKERAAMAKLRWGAMQAGAEASYDRTETCSFTSFVAYEYTNTRGVSNLHRNVIFRNANVPNLPVTFFEADTHWKLWSALDAECARDGKGCDALSIGHNSNLSNGHYFLPRYDGASAKGDQAAKAALRARVEPLVEMFQHKGDMECRNGMDKAVAADPMCDFEKQRPKGAEQCPEDEPGSFGMRLLGCVHRLDFVRPALIEGLKEAARLGENPHRFGLVAATDTHNGTPGNVAPHGFVGHVGVADDTPDKRLAVKGTVTHDGVINNPGGLAGVWAVENSRDAIFEAFDRRETFATSGPRIALRMFGGWGYADDVCASADWLEKADDGGVPMGSLLPLQPPGKTAPRFVVHAAWDAGTVANPGTKLSHLQIVKGWIDADGKGHEKVVTIAGSYDPSASADAKTCAPAAGGHEALCGVYVDADWQPGQRALWYARVIELPSCRWSTRTCNALPPAEQPPACTDNDVPKLVRQRAWSSSIWSRHEQPKNTAP